ncbi:MAG: putative photosynthetic complex assembly protein PuhE [Myxococcota bacterium]
MLHFFIAAGFAIFTWWFSTGAILYVDRSPPSTYPRSFAVASTLSFIALAGLLLSAKTATPLGAYMSFSSALVLWGWHELTFLMGWVTGPRRHPCPPEATGWRRFRLATEVVIHHELALFATLVLIIALTWGAPNRVGLWTFTVLWTMRISAKLNIFLGVRNLAEEFIPSHLEYMTTYFRKATYNPLMPISLTASLGTVWLLALEGLEGGSSVQRSIETALVGTLLGLAALEHLFLMLPVPDTLLWRWALRDQSS